MIYSLFFAIKPCIFSVEMSIFNIIHYVIEFYYVTRFTGPRPCYHSSSNQVRVLVQIDFGFDQGLKFEPKQASQSRTNPGQTWAYLGRLTVNYLNLRVNCRSILPINDALPCLMTFEFQSYLFYLLTAVHLGKMLHKVIKSCMQLIIF